MIASVRSQALKALTPQSAIRVDRSRCVRHRCRPNDCRRCLEVCTAGAITWTERGLLVETEACTQCLRCLSVCPTAALQAAELSLPRIVSDLAAHRSAVLGCHNRPETEAHARLACLGYLAHPEVMLFLALVLEDGVQLDLTSCHGCSNAHVLPGIETAFAELSQIKPDHGVRLVRDRHDLEHERVALSRRQLFASWRQRSARTASVMVNRLRADEKPQSFGTKQVPATRVLLLRAMAGHPQTVRKKIADRLFGRISFTSTCDACGGCVGVCPTGAIRPAGGAAKVPAFDRAFCVACNSCQAFCRERGVVVADGGLPGAEAQGSAEAGTTP